MSMVDNVILSFSVQEDFIEDDPPRGYPIMEQVNEWMREHGGQDQRFGPDLGAVYGMMHKAIFDALAGEQGDEAIAKSHADEEAVEVVGGAKPLETPLFVAAFNYLPLDDFMEFLRTLPWRRPGSVQVIVKRQQSDVFEILEL